MAGAPGIRATVFAVAWLTSMVTSLDVYQSEHGPVTSIVLENSGRLIVGGRNSIFQFKDSNLSVANLENYIDIRYIDGHTGLANVSDNDVSILSSMSINNTQHILFCGTDTSKKCYALKADNITDFSELDGPSVGSKTSASVVIVTNLFDEPSVYSAMDFQFSRTNTYTFSLKEIMQHVNKFTISDAPHQTFIKPTDDQHLQFIYGFSNGDYVYFLRNNMSYTRQAYLSQVCVDDIYFSSYVEMRISCGDYSVAESAFTVGSSSSWLVATFSSTKHPGSAMCTFDVTKLSEAFASAKRKCFNEASGSWPHWIQPTKATEGQSCASRINTRYSIDCPRLHNTRILAVDVIQNPPVLVDNTKVMTSSALTSKSNKMIIYLGDSKGIIRKVLFDSTFTRQCPVYSTDTGDGVAIRRGMVLDDAGSTLFFTYGDKVAALRTDDCTLHKTCESCLSDVMSCSWLATNPKQGRCIPGNQSADDVYMGSDAVYTDHCPPVITEMTPSSGPCAGGTKLTITGQFGHKSDRINIPVVTVGEGNTCRIAEVSKERIVCITSSVAMETDAVVTLTLFSGNNDNSFLIPFHGNVSCEKKFMYKNPALEVNGSNIYVQRGGGVQVSFYGSGLDIGSGRSVLVGGFNCSIHDVDNVTDNLLTCRAPAVTQPGFFPVIMKIDGAELPGPSITYLSSPVLSSVYPDRVIESGGVSLTLGGARLEGLGSKVYIDFLDVHGNLLSYKSEECSVQANQLECVSGAVNSSMLLLTAESQESRIKITNIYRDLPFLVTDGDTFQNVTFSVVADPELYPFENNYFIKADEDNLTLKGKRLLNVDRSEFKIFIGSITCTVMTMTDDVIKCRVTSHFQTGQILPIVAHIGYRTYTLGNAIYQKDALLGHTIAPDPNSSYVHISIGIGVFVVLAMALMVATIKYQTYRRRKRQQYDPYSASFHRNGDFITLDGLSESHTADADQNQRNIYQEQTFAKSTAETGSGAADTEPLLLDNNTKLWLERQKLLIDRNHLVLGEVLGQGHFGCVYKCYYRVPDEKEEKIVAAKTLHRPNPKDLDVQMFLQEALLMKDFHHKHVMQLLGVCLGLDSLPLVILPYMQKGDLLSYIRDSNNSPRVADLVEFGIDIANGMHYLSQLKFVHRDLAARNCMLTDDLTVKIADFGLSRDVYEKEYYSSNDKTAKLPIKWMSPESLEFRLFTSKSDVWSYGVVLWELLTRGMTPYPTVDNWEILAFLKAGRRMSKPDHCPSKVFKVMQRCWEWNPDDRPTFGDLTIELPEILRK